MDTLDRYLLREFFVYFAITLVGLGSLYLGVEFLSGFARMTARMSTAQALEFYLCRIPQALLMFFPVACLMAMLLVLAMMSRQNEVLALYASGVGPLRIISTFIAAVALTSTGAFLFFDTTIPMFNKRLILIDQGLDPNTAELATHFQGAFWLKSGSRIYSIGRFIPQTNRIEEVDVYFLSPQFQLLQRVHAKNGIFDGQDWELYDGYAVSMTHGSPFPELQWFTSKRGLIRERPSEFKTLTFRDDVMGLKDLRRYINRNNNSGLDTTGQQVTYHDRVATVFTPLIFLLLGFPFALKPMSRLQSMPKSIAFCFAVVFMYLLIQRMSLSIGREGHIPPVVAAWTPNILFFVLAGFMISRRN